MNYLLQISVLIFGLNMSSALAQAPDDSELLALRFYVGEENASAVQSEIRRLQLKYPDWKPPSNLNQLEQSVPEDAIALIYRQIREAEYNLARESIERTTQTFPDWTPSQELLETLSLAEAQTRFSDAVIANDPSLAIRVALSAPALLRCERINNAWLLAEQYQKEGQNQTALAVYRNTLKSCSGLDSLVATLEKSTSITNADELAALADIARAQAPEATERLTTLENRLKAGLKSLSEASALNGSAQSDAGTVFDLSTPQITQRPKARPLPNENKPVETAKDIAAQSVTQPAARGNLGQAKQAADRGDWLGCLAALSNAQGAQALSQRGWCSLNSDRTMQAIDDFRKAAATAPNARLARDSSYGLALALLRMNMIDQAAQIAASINFDAAQRLEVESQILDKRGVFAFGRKDYRRAIAYFDELQRVTGVMRRDLALLRGYAYLNSGQRSAAVAEFQRLHDQMATSESRKALATALGGD